MKIYLDTYENMHTCGTVSGMMLLCVLGDLVLRMCEAGILNGICVLIRFYETAIMQIPRIFRLVLITYSLRRESINCFIRASVGKLRIESQGNYKGQRQKIAIHLKYIEDL